MTFKLLLIFSPFLIQAGMTFFDEFYFHHKRGLPLWERLGHPLDTMTVLACYAFVIKSDPTATNLCIYLALAAFSCLFITKDEFVHHEKSCAKEQWLHANLFVIHPIGLGVLLLYWYGKDNQELLSTSEYEIFCQFIIGQFIIVSIFLCYQILFWSIPWKTLLKAKFKSTTTTTIT